MLYSWFIKTNVVIQIKEIVVGNTMWLLETYGMDAYYGKIDKVRVGLFKTADSAKNHAKAVLGKNDEDFIWSCEITELEVFA